MGEHGFAISCETSCMNSQLLMPHKRSLYLDQIKAVIVALVIAIHVPMAFSVGWIGIKIPVEGAIGPVFKGFFAWYSIAINSFIMPTRFLLSGYFVPRTVYEKGIGQYLNDRLARLGMPFLMGMLLINSSSTLLSKLSPSSYFAKIPWSNLPLSQTYVLWFLIVLFAFDLLFCGYVVTKRDRYEIDVTVPTPGMRSWLISAVILGFLEVVMAMQIGLWSALLGSPLSALGIQGPHIFTYAFLFFLGCKASCHNWFERLDSHLVMKWFRLSLFLLLSLFGLSMVFAFNANLLDSPAMLFLVAYALYPFIAWGIVSYLILWFQRNEGRFGQWLSTAGINSYGAYVIHPLVLVVALLIFGFVGINPWLIVLISTVFSVFISFGVAGQLRRIPAVAKVL